MFKRSHVLVAIVWLLSLASSFGQVGFTLPSYSNTNTGDVLDFPVKVVNFDSVFSMQYVMRWDPQVLEFQSLDHVPNPLAIVDSLCFNLTQAGQGIIRFRWFSTLYKTLPNETAIYSLKMKVVGANGSASSLYFTELPPVTYFEVVRGASNQIFNLNLPPQALLTNGQVTVGMVDGFEPGLASSSLLVYPNPFSNSFSVAYESVSVEEARVYITDLLGKIIFEEKKYPNLGRVGMEIANVQIPGKGTYFLHVVQGDVHAVRPIVYQ